MKRKCFFLLIFISSCWIFIFAQHQENKSDQDSFVIDSESLRGCKDSRLSDGTCKGVIDLLRITQDSDSIAVDIFKEEYEITNMRYAQKEWLIKKNYVEIINYFNLEENKDYYCRSKILKRFDPVLLIE